MGLVSVWRVIFAARNPLKYTEEEIACSAITSRVLWIFGTNEGFTLMVTVRTWAHSVYDHLTTQGEMEIMLGSGLVKGTITEQSETYVMRITTVEVETSPSI